MRFDVLMEGSLLQSTFSMCSLETLVSLCSVRTSSGMFLLRGQDDIVRRIEEKIAMRTMIPVENGEGLQVEHNPTTTQWQ